MDNNLNDVLSSIQQRQATIDVLFKKRLLRTDKDGGECQTWEIQPLIQRDDCSIGFASCKDPADLEFPCHVHGDVIEYLICVQGSFLEFFENQGVRIVRPGECVSIPKNTVHKSRAIEPNTVLVYVCIPADKAINALMDRVRKG